MTTLLLDDLEWPVLIKDHLGGFDRQLQNEILIQLNHIAGNRKCENIVKLEFPVFDDFKKAYPNLTFQSGLCEYAWQSFVNYKTHYFIF